MAIASPHVVGNSILKLVAVESGIEIASSLHGGLNDKGTTFDMAHTVPLGDDRNPIVPNTIVDNYGFFYDNISSWDSDKYVFPEKHGISMSDLSYFISQSLCEVINRIIEVAPQQAKKFGKKITIPSGSGVQGHGHSPGQTLKDNPADGVEVPSGIVFNAYLSYDTSTSTDDSDLGVSAYDGGDFYPATEIDVSIAHLCSNRDSLHYKSQYNPGYYIEDNTLYMIPTPGTTAGLVGHANILHYSDTILLTNGTEVGINASTMGWELDSNLSFTTTPPADVIGAYDIEQGETYYYPKYPVDPNKQIFGSFPKHYQHLVIQNAAMRCLIRLLNANPDFEKWYKELDVMLQDQRDPELGSIQVQKISSFLSGYQQQVLNRYQVIKTEYEASLSGLSLQHQANMARRQQAQQQRRSRRRR